MRRPRFKRKLAFFRAPKLGCGRFQRILFIQGGRCFRRCSIAQSGALRLRVSRSKELVRCSSSPPPPSCSPRQTKSAPTFAQFCSRQSQEALFAAAGAVKMMMMTADQIIARCARADARVKSIQSAQEAPREEAAFHWSPAVQDLGLNSQHCAEEQCGLRFRTQVTNLDEKDSHLLTAS